MKELTSEAFKSYKHLKESSGFITRYSSTNQNWNHWEWNWKATCQMLLTLSKKALPSDMMMDFKMKEATTETSNVTGSSLSVSDASV